MIESIERGRKEDGNRSIADKIIKRLHDLKKTVQNNHGRWAWELLQNAKDSIAETDRKVAVRIQYSKEKIQFFHNGNHFTEKDIRGLINQISSKEVEEGEESTKTGRFGTGFLTTHMISKRVIVEGIVETTDGRLFDFNFPLNRNGETTQALIPRIEEAWSEFHLSTENSEIEDYDSGEFNTSFTYELESEEQHEIASIGVNEFASLLPYVLVFIPQIEQVQIIDDINGDNILFENQEEVNNGFKLITKTKNGKKKNIRLLYKTDGEVSIAIRALKKGNTYEILNLENVPKLFCDFPLIGTENFHLPVVVNSFYFNPQTERDGIWLMGDKDVEVIENRELLKKAIVLYKDLVDELESGTFSQLFNVVNVKTPQTDERYFDVRWYKEHIREPLREFLMVKKIVEREDETKEELGKIWFPLKSYSEEIREKLWQYNYDLYPDVVCKLEDLNDWIEVIWSDKNKISYTELVTDISGFTSLTELSQTIGNEKESLEWINEVGEFLLEEETNETLFEKHAIIPNQNGTFLKKSELFIDKINDQELIKVLRLLGEDWNDILIHNEITFGRYFVKEKVQIATKINEKLKNISTENPDYIKAISLLSEWFDDNEEEGKDLFADTYRKRAELFMNTIKDKDSLYKVMRSTTDLSHLSRVAEAIQEHPKLFEDIEQAKDIYTLLKQYNINDLGHLRSLLANGGSENSTHQLLPITQEILLDMGISSLEEWQETIKNKDLSQLFSHESTPTTDMFVYVQSLIKQAKENIKRHLSTLDRYNLDDLDESTAPTILAGILKDEKPISIVARPAYNGEVIIYYGSERDILDFEASELWIDDGKKPRSISLGHVLKTAKIIKFPI